MIDLIHDILKDAAKLRCNGIPRELRIRHPLVALLANLVADIGVGIQVIQDLYQVFGGGAGHLTCVVGIHINVVATNQLAIPFENFFTRRMVRHHLGHTTCSVFEVDETPSLTFARVNTHIASVIDGIQHVYRYVRRPFRLASHDDATVGIEANPGHLPAKDTHHIPALVLKTHVEVQTSLRASNRKLSKCLDGDVNPFAELISVPVEDNEQVLI